MIELTLPAGLNQGATFPGHPVFQGGGSFPFLPIAIQNSNNPLPFKPIFERLKRFLIILLYHHKMVI
jgi:hypothetical protein